MTSHGACMQCIKSSTGGLPPWSAAEAFQSLFQDYGEQFCASLTAEETPGATGILHIQRRSAMLTLNDR